MSNTLTALARESFLALQDARRQNHGMIQACSTDFDVSAVPLNEYIDMPYTTAGSNADATPAAAPSQGDNDTTGVRKLQLTKRRKNSFYVTGDDTKTIDRIGFGAWYQNKLKKAMIKILDEIENDLTGLYVEASYGHGTPGTTPFGSNFNETAVLRRFAEEAGTVDDLQLVINPIAAQNLRSLTQLTKANEAGTDATLRNAELLDLNGFKIRLSSQIRTHTIGTGSAYITNGGEAVGATSLTIDGGSGTFVQGDLLTVTGDSLAKYIASGDVSGGELAINGGLKKIVADGIGVAIGASYAANMAFARRSIGLAIRPTATPPGGDAASEAMIVSDLPVAQGGTGLSFLVLRYGQYLQASYEVHATWGVKCFEPEALFNLAG
jgi:hypothetical protein